MNNPGTILKVWIKLVKKHEDGKKPADLGKKGQEQKTKIKVNLTRLKFEGAADMTAPAHREAFVKLRDKSATLMRKYCRYLKAAKDEDKKLLPKYLRMVKQLTVVVQNLDPSNLDQNESDAPLESLDAVDTASLDQMLEQPDTEAEGEEESAEAEASEKATPATQQPTSGPNLAKQWQERWGHVSAAMLPVLKNKPANAALIQQTAGDAMKQARAGNYEAALATVEKLETLLKPGKTTAKSATGPSSAELMKVFNEMSARVKQAVVDHPGHKQDVLQKAAAFMTQVKANQLAEAEQTLEDLNSTLDGLQMAGADAGGEEDLPATEDKPKFTEYATARLAWIATRQKADTDLKKLEKAILEAFKDDAVLPTIKKNVRRLDVILKTLDETLADKLDQALNAEGESRTAFHQEARGVVARYLQFLKSNPLAIDLDDNPFVPLQVNKNLTTTLTLLASKLA